jgi:L-glutamine-phosphate cytidylyltransferase
MKLILLSAGKGTRMMPLTKNTPKPLLDLGNGSTVLEAQLDQIGRIPEIKEVFIVVGYRAEQIEAKLKTYTKGIATKVTIIFNPFYDMSNNLMSLWCARHEMTGDFLIMNGDNIIEHTAFRKLFTRATKDGIYLTVDRKDAYDEDDMKVLHEDHLVTKVSKTVSISEACAESIGLALIRGQNQRNFYREAIEHLVREQSSRNVFWLETFNHLSDKGYPVYWAEIDRDEWREIDFKIDYHRAREIMLLQDTNNQDGAL